jgi:hypothetical protein
MPQVVNRRIFRHLKPQFRLPHSLADRREKQHRNIHGLILVHSHRIPEKAAASHSPSTDLERFDSYFQGRWFHIRQTSNQRTMFLGSGGATY